MKPSLNSRSIVAVVLSLTVLGFVLLGVLRSYNPALLPVSIDVLSIWGDLIKVIVGGLIGYMSQSDK